MDLQTGKLNVIRYLVGLQDEKMIREIELLINESIDESKQFEPLTEDDLIFRANESNSDYEKGKVIDQTQLKKESHNW